MFPVPRLYTALAAFSPRMAHALVAVRHQSIASPSALVFGGGMPGQVRLAWQRGVLLPFASTATVQELMRVLADYLQYVETVRIPQPPPQVPECRDAMDMPFKHLAVVGKAKALISGDRNLLAIASAFEQASGCPILSLEAFSRLHLNA